MMPGFIDSTNQTLLYNTVRKLPIFLQHHSNVESGVKWFKQQMGFYYKQFDQENTDCTHEKLMEINKYVLDNMIQSLYQSTKVPPATTPPVHVQVISDYPTTLIEIYQMMELLKTNFESIKTDLELIKKHVGYVPK